MPRCQHSVLWKPTDHRGHELLQVSQFGLSAEGDSISVVKQTHKQTNKTNKKSPLRFDLKCRGCLRFLQEGNLLRTGTPGPVCSYPAFDYFSVVLQHSVSPPPAFLFAISILHITFLSGVAVRWICLQVPREWRQICQHTTETLHLGKFQMLAHLHFHKGIYFLSLPSPAFMSLHCSVTNKMLFWTGWKVMQDKVSFS